MEIVKDVKWVTYIDGLRGEMFIMDSMSIDELIAMLKNKELTVPVIPELSNVFLCYTWDGSPVETLIMIVDHYPKDKDEWWFLNTDDYVFVEAARDGIDYTFDYDIQRRLAEQQGRTYSQEQYVDDRRSGRVQPIARELL